MVPGPPRSSHQQKRERGVLTAGQPDEDGVGGGGDDNGGAEPASDEGNHRPDQRKRTDEGSHHGGSVEGVGDSVRQLAERRVDGSHVRWIRIHDEAALGAEEADLRSSQRVMARYITVSGLLILLNIYLLIGFYRGVSSTVHELQITAEALAGGDLAVRIEPSTDDEMADIAYSFNKISEAFDKVVSSVKRSMTQVEGSVTSVSSVATETMSGMADHHQEIDVMVSAMTEMVATAQEVEKNTVEAASATKEADNHTKEGELVVQSAISTIQQLAQEVVRTSGVMKQLAEDANGIGAVTDVIRGIADQTNLLALNAAIEAARAGEQGRGFAVVADEVRTLAQRTRESTDEIQNMINTLQSASEDALGVINASRDSVDESVEKICKTGSALESINVSVERVNCMNEQIASAATEQACTADEITHNMERVRNIAEQASEGASRLVSAAEQLEMLSRDTSDELSRYKVTG